MTMTMPHITGSTTMSDFGKRLDKIRGGLARAPQGLFELAWRIAVGATFFKSGVNKIESWDSTIGLFRDEYKLPILPPELAALLGTTAELVCPVLLVLGLLARFGAAALLAMTLVIQFLVYPGNWAEHLMWGSLLAWIVSRGPGPISLDRLIAGRLFGRG